jgi:hypothetical protein
MNFGDLRGGVECYTCSRPLLSMATWISLERRAKVVGLEWGWPLRWYGPGDWAVIQGNHNGNLKSPS